MNNEHMEWIDVDCREVNFRGADLENCIFRGCDLREADFREANLKNAKMLYCDLRSVNFEGAAHDGLDLTGSVANIDPYKKGGTEEKEFDEWAKKVLAVQRKIYQEKTKK